MSDDGGNESTPDDLGIEQLGVEEVQPSPRSRPTGELVRALGAPADDELGIYVHERVLAQSTHHVSEDTSVERGGLLVGNFCIEGEQHWIDVHDQVEARHTESSRTHLRFTTETWKETDEVLEGRYPEGEAVGVGWYHSHPGLTVFVSEYDKQVHKLFHSWWQVAIVIDPISKEVGCFRVMDGELRRCPGMLVYGEEPTQGRANLSYAGARHAADAPPSPARTTTETDVSSPPRGDAARTTASEMRAPPPPVPTMNMAVGLAVMGLGVVVAAVILALAFGGGDETPPPLALPDQTVALLELFRDSGDAEDVVRAVDLVVASGEAQGQPGSRVCTNLLRRELKARVDRLWADLIAWAGRPDGQPAAFEPPSERWKAVEAVWPAGHDVAGKDASNRWEYLQHVRALSSRDNSGQHAAAEEALTTSNTAMEWPGLSARVLTRARRAGGAEQRARWRISVEDGEARPLPGAEVELRFEDGRVRSGETNDLGHVHFSEWPGRYALRARARNLGVQTNEGHTDAGDVRVAFPPLKARLAIRGETEGEESPVGLGGVRVRVILPGADALEVITDAEGEAEVLVPSYGTYRVEFQKEGYESLIDTLTIEAVAKEAPQVVLKRIPTRLHQLVVYVVDDRGDPLEGEVDVELLDDDDDILRTAKRDSDLRRFVFDGLTGRAYRLAVRPEGTRYASQLSDVSVPDRRAAFVQVRPQRSTRRISFVSMDPGNAQLMRLPTEVVVTLRPVDGPQGETRFLVKSTEDGSGEVEFQGLTEGEYSVRAFSQFYESAPRTLMVGSPALDRPMKLELRLRRLPAPVIELRSDHGPVEGAKVTLALANGEPKICDAIGNGQYRHANPLPAGIWTLSVEKKGLIVDDPGGAWVPAHSPKKVRLRARKPAAPRGKGQSTAGPSREPAKR